MKSTYKLHGAEISIGGDPWFIEAIEIKYGIRAVARNLVATSKDARAKQALLEEHFFNWGASSLNYAECVYLQGARTFANNNPDKMVEIMHSGYARPIKYDIPEWAGMTLAEFVDLLKNGRPNPLTRDLEDAKIYAITHIRDAPVPPMYLDAAKRVLEIFGENFMWINGDAANQELAAMAVKHARDHAK